MATVLGYERDTASGALVTVSPADIGVKQASFKGRAGTFRTPGLAGTVGQKLFALHNASGSTVIVTVDDIRVDLLQTAVRVETVASPILRLHRFTALPTNGNSVAKVGTDSSLSSSASVTAWGNASADGTASGTALAVTIPASSLLDQTFTPRLITAVGWDTADPIKLIDDPDDAITLRAGEGVVVFLDYTFASNNPTSDMWTVSAKWRERAA